MAASRRTARRPGRRIPSAFVILGGVGAAVMVLVVLLLVGGGGSGPSVPPPPTKTTPPPRPAPPTRLFAADSVWNAPVPANAPLDPDSAAIAGWFAKEAASEIRAGTGPTIETHDYSSPLYTVPANQPTVRVSLGTPKPYKETLQAAFDKVPLPPDAKPSRGTDGHLTVYQPSTDKLWEFWRLHKGADGWTAGWGGAMQNVSKSPGYYTPQSWPGARPNWGSTASSLPVIAGTMLISELQRRDIPHALALSIPRPQAGVWSWPAQRTDGHSTDPAVPPEGAHLRIDPKLDIDKLHLDPTVAAIAKAVQRYGMIVRDGTGHAITLSAEDPTQYKAAHGGVSPYKNKIFSVQPYLMLRDFPWQHLQLLRMAECRNANRPCTPQGQRGARAAA